MQKIHRTLDRLYSVTGLPFTLFESSGRILKHWPPEGEVSPVTEGANRTVIGIFMEHKGDEDHPLISFLDPGFLLAVLKVSSDLYLEIGLVSPFPQTRADILRVVSEAIHPASLHAFCDRLMTQPPVSLEKLRDLICLTGFLLGRELREENILFEGNVPDKAPSPPLLDHFLFEQREEAVFHVPTDFEAAVCSAIEAGDRPLLEHSLFSSYQGRVGRMSADDLRQAKYSFVCMATLSSRAAIRGGLDEETAFSISDLYCQRADLVREAAPLSGLTFTMLTDYCQRVREIRKTPALSQTVQKCLSYISVHLHEPISLDLLSRHCGLCGRSLSIRFKEEMHMGIPEYIHREKLREAAYLLRHTDYSLSEITVYLNYPSQSYFTQIFKKYRSVTPQQYRNTLR